MYPWAAHFPATKRSRQPARETDFVRARQFQRLVATRASPRTVCLTSDSEAEVR